MRGDLGALYDTHAARLHAHCWSLVGDRNAAAAVTDAFVAAVQHPPRGDRVLWLYALSRSACASLGAFSGDRPALGAAGDPLLHAAAALPPDHREALLLWAGEWLEVGDIARVLGIAPDTAAGLLTAARTRLERTVLDRLMRGAAHPAVHAEVVTAFEKGRLPRLLAGRAPDRPPGWLRDQVIAACDAEAAQPLSGVVSPSPLVVIGSDVAGPLGRDRARARAKGIGAVAGMAASVAAAVGLLAAWPGGKGDGVSAVTPSAGETRTDPAAGNAVPTGSGTRSGSPVNERTTAPEPSTATQERRPAGPPAGSPAGSPAGTGGDPATGSAPAAASAPGTPDKREAAASPTAPGTSPAETSPPASSPAPTAPADPDGTGGPGGDGGTGGTTPPVDPSQPPGTTPPVTPPPQTPSPGPSPTSNPVPSPGTGG